MPCATTIHGPGDIRVEDVPDPALREPTDAIVRVVRGCLGRRALGLCGGMAPVRRYLPELLALVQSGRIDPGRIFDLTLPLEESPAGYRAMDERRAVKVMLQS